jgi:hypothetical protein
MASARKYSVARTVGIGLAVALALFVAQSVAGMVAALGFNSYSSPLDLNRNNSIPDLVSTAAILVGALGAAVLAGAQVGWRWRATALAIVLSLVALDDLLHAEAEGGGARAMYVAGTLAAVLVLILAVAWRAPRAAAVSLLVGLVLLVVAVKEAYWYDQFLNTLQRGDQERGDLDYELGIVLKNGLELLGWSLVATGLWAMALAARAQPRRAPAPAPTVLAPSAER